MNKPRVLLADDHVLVAEGLKRLLDEDFELLGVVSDGRALVAEAKRLLPDVIVADISMPDLNGIEAIVLLKRDNPSVRIVMLTMHQNAAYARRALEAGASGYVLKHSAPAELVLAIHAALRGRTFLTPALAGEVIGAESAGQSGPVLTIRQREILRLMVDGHSAKQIGKQIGISARTVEYHKYQIMEAHGLQNSVELIRLAIRLEIART